MLNKHYRVSLYYSYINLAVLALSQIILVPLIIEKTSEEEYAVYVVFLTIITGFTNVIGWLGASSVRMLSEYYHNGQPDKFNDLYSLLKVAFFFYSILVLVIYYFVDIFYVDHYLLIGQQEPVIISISALVYIWLLINTSVESNVLTAMARLDVLNKYRAGLSIFALCMAIYLLNVFATSSAFLIASSVMVTLLFFLILKYIIANEQSYLKLTKLWGFDTKEVKRVFYDVGAKAFLYSVLRYLLLIDPLIMSLFMTKSEIAMYSYYWLPANYLIIILWKFSENAQPFFMKAFAVSDTRSLFESYQKVYKKTVWLSVIAAFCFYLFFPYFSYYWVGLETIDGFALVTYAVLVILLAVNRINLAILYANANYTALIKGTVIELLLKLLFILVLFDYVGFYVAVIAHLISQACFTLYYSGRLRKREMEIC